MIEYNKLSKTIYGIITDNENAMYCEIKYNRDRSSFAGIAFEITEGRGITCSCIEEIEFKKVSRYEKIYVGIEEDYYKMISQMYYEKEMNIGLNILFLVYSDVRSSQVIFGKLMEWLIDNIQ